MGTELSLMSNRVCSWLKQDREVCARGEEASDTTDDLVSYNDTNLTIGYCPLNITSTILT